MRPEHANVSAHVQQAVTDASTLHVSVIAIGEISHGHAITTKPDPQKQAAFTAWIQQQFPNPLQITVHTAEHYGELRTTLFQQYAPKNKKHVRTEDCFDQTTGKELGIQENDLWMTAQAAEHDLIFVTHDGMEHIKNAAKIYGIMKDPEDWTNPL
jgi:predicted nucleic acid-binding protein